MTLKQHAQSLYELGMQIKEFNPSITQIYFEIKDANPYEMEALAKETKRDLIDTTIDGKSYLRLMAQPYGEYNITIWAYSIPVQITPALKWALLPENVGALRPEQATPLTPFTSEIDNEREEEVLRMHFLTGKE